MNAGLRKSAGMRYVDARDGILADIILLFVSAEQNMRNVQRTASFRSTGSYYSFSQSMSSREVARGGNSRRAQLDMPRAHNMCFIFANRAAARVLIV